MSQPMVDLAEIPDEDLVDELSRRYDHFFVLATRKNLETVELTEIVLRRGHGDATKLMGALFREMIGMSLQQINDSKDLNDDDDER